MSVEISNNNAIFQRNERKISFEGINARKYIDLFSNSPVSDAFVKEMAQGIESMGIVGQKTIKGQNLRYKIAQKTSDIFPELKGHHPEGWPEGTTVDNAPGFSAVGFIALFEKPIDQPKPNITLVRHETLHGLDSLFGKIFKGNEFFTDTKGFTKAYLKDIKNLPENMKKYGKKVKDADTYINYLIQGSNPQKANTQGKREAFAVIGAKLNGGSDQEKLSKGMDKLIDKVFPNTVAYVEKLLWLLGKR